MTFPLSATGQHTSNMNFVGIGIFTKPCAISRLQKSPSITRYTSDFRPSTIYIVTIVNYGFGQMKENVYPSDRLVRFHWLSI